MTVTIAKTAICLSQNSLGQAWDKLGQFAGVFHRCSRPGTKILPSGRQKEYALVPEPNVFAIIRVPRAGFAFYDLFKGGDFMCSNGSTGRICKIFLILPLLLTVFLISDAAAQYSCDDSHTVKKRTTARRVYEPVYADNKIYNDKGAVYYGDGEILPDPDYYDTRRIARDYGFRDGWYDGKQAGMERDAYHPQNSGDYQKATNGYEDDFGPKRLYKQAYRSAYLSGYRAGFRSIANRSTYRAARNR